MEVNDGQFSELNIQISAFEKYIDELISENGKSLDVNSVITFSDVIKDSFTQKKEEFFVEIIKKLCISVLCGDYIEIDNFFEKFGELEKRIEELPNKTNDFPPDIQSQIFDICSAIIIIIELYKDFFSRIENYYSEDRVQFLFERNTQIQKELNKQPLQSETERKISYFLNLLKVTSIDHFPSTENQHVFEIFKTEDYLDNFKDPIFRDMSIVIVEKVKFLKFKWKERRLQENPFMYSYMENGIHKTIGDYNPINPKLKDWKEIIHSQYETNSLGWKAMLSNRVKHFKNDDVNSLTENLKIHQLIKYYKDVNTNDNKLSKISTKLLDDKNKKLCSNFYDKYAENIFCNYALNNEFSNYLGNETSIEKITSKYEEIKLKLDDTTNNYFLKFKYLNKVFDLLMPKISEIDKDLFIKNYEYVLDKCKVTLKIYQENIDWASINFNYIFLLPIKESKAKFKIDGIDYDVFFASSFVLPPSSKIIENDFNTVKEKFDKLNSYLDFSKFFSLELNEIKEIKDELSSKEIKSLELLSLFTAVISFIIGGISGFAFIKDLYTALLFFVVFTTSLLTFLLALFVFTRGKKIIRDNKKYIIWMYSIFVIAIISLTVSNLIKSEFLDKETEVKKLEERFRKDSILNKARSYKSLPNKSVFSNVDSLKIKSTP